MKRIPRRKQAHQGSTRNRSRRAQALRELLDLDGARAVFAGLQARPGRSLLLGTLLEEGHLRLQDGLAELTGSGVSILRRDGQPVRRRSRGQQGQSGTGQPGNGQQRAKQVGASQSRAQPSGSYPQDTPHWYLDWDC